MVIPASVVRGRDDEGPSAHGRDASTTGGVSVPTARTAPPRLALTPAVRARGRVRARTRARARARVRVDVRVRVRVRVG